MTGDLLSDSLITVPFGRMKESVASTRYDWPCGNRDRVPFVIVQWTTRGYGLVEREGKTREVPPGHLFIAIPPEPCRYYYPAEAATSWEFSWINFYGKFGVTLWYRLRSEFGTVLPMPRDSEAARLYAELVRLADQRQFADPYDAGARAYAFYIALLRQLALPISQLSPVQAALQHLESASRARVTVKELAALSGISREHFTRLFQESQGCSPATWLRNRRLEDVKMLLATTSAPLAEVALRCGFSSARHLRQAFRQRFGKLPGESRGMES